jgi:hypothetical protein
VGTATFSMVRASHGVLAKHVCPGIVHSSSLEDGHHCREAHVSVWISAKEEPQKNLYLRFGSVSRAEVVDVKVVRRRSERVER